jgi:saccharopine dehydrogenase-like NADP-dependent oxidoreductase
MIDYVVGGEYLNVTSNKGAVPYINMHSNQPMVGMLTFDPSSQQMKVYDGGSWQIVGGGSAIVNLTPNAISILKWAEKKMFEEQELKVLCDKHPAIKDIVGEMRISMDNYINKIEMVKALIKEEVKV